MSYFVSDLLCLALFSYKQLNQLWTRTSCIWEMLEEGVFKLRKQSLKNEIKLSRFHLVHRLVYTSVSVCFLAALQNETYI